MVLLCFVLDLPNLSFRILQDLKQVLSHVANLYAVASCGSGRRQTEALPGRIGLCYFFFNRLLCSHELKVAYRPRRKFSLLDFHRALNSLPGDAYCPQTRAFSSRDQKLSRVLCDEVLYSWEGNDPSRKVIYLSSYLFEEVSPDTRHILMEVADKCITVEFILLEDNLIYFNDDADDGVDDFVRCISDIENCSFRKYVPDFQLLSRFVKQWLKEMNEELSEPIQAHFAFKHKLIGTVNHIVCHLSRSFNYIMDEFSSYKEDMSSLFQMIGCDTERSDMSDNSLRAGEQVSSGISSHGNCKNLEGLVPISFNVMERINLGSLSEGVIIGASYFVTPSTSYVTDASLDDLSMPDMNVAVFRGLCNILHSLDQGLLCTSDCDVETIKYLPLKCYYLLQPSDNGPMLLRRLAALEEVLPIPDMRQFPSLMSEQAMHSLQTNIESMELRDYNPLSYERGLHQKLNMLVERSLSVRSTDAANIIDLVEEDPSQFTSHEKPEDPFRFTCDDNPEIGVSAEEKVIQTTPATTESETSRVAQEWVQLINETPQIVSPARCIPPSKSSKHVDTPIDSCTHLDERTSKILERLEFPRQHQGKQTSPCMNRTTSVQSATQSLIPFLPFHASAVSKEPMKPRFQRIKRKQK